MNNKYPVCPICGNEATFYIDWSPYGDTECLKCNHKASHEYFSIEQITEDTEHMDNYQIISKD